MIKILNAETMREKLLGHVRHVRVYNGKVENSFATEQKPLIDEAVIVRSEVWKNSAGRERLLNDRHILIQRITNAATGYDYASLAALIGNYVIDLQRLTDDLTVYTSQLVTERADADAPESVKLRNYLPYIGKEEQITGASDSVPLMNHNLPVDVSLDLFIRGFGDKTTLRELVFNPFHKTELIMDSAARILADGQNGDVIKPIVTATYDAAHSQAADTTGATADIQVYLTIRNAIRKAVRLYNIPTGKQNGLMAHQNLLLLNPMDVDDVVPIISGGLERLAGINLMVGRLPIDGIIPYGGGLNDGLSWGNETLLYPGVPAGTFFILVKNDVFGGYKIVKRSPTMEMGDGDVLALTTEKRAWHRIDGTFLEWILPTAAGGKNYGAVIKGTFPS
ncbi:MAG: hypothetical protein LBS57_12175 [Treponema sp.]|jgi:hypothetical protein|nr:hypothetical protein [Treponema sp.]